MFRNLYTQDDDAFEVNEPIVENEWLVPPALLEELPKGLIEDQA